VSAVSGSDVRKSLCWFCKGRCGVHVHVHKGHLERIDLDREYATRAGSAAAGCAGLRLRYAPDWYYGPGRLHFPLRRSGPRGSGQWTRVSWDTALEEIASRLRGLAEVHGPHTLATCKGDDWTHSEYETRFMNIFGSPNIFGASPICWGPRALVSEAVFGWHPIYSAGPATKCIVMLGVNPDVGRPALVRTVREAVARGAKIITLDPRRTSIALRSDLWLRLRPGTDAAVLLAMIEHIIRRRLYDELFVRRFCHGFEALRVRAAEYPLARAASISGVAAADIARAAELYAASRPGVIFEGMGVEQQTNSTDIIHARCILAAITGNVDVEGGEELDGPHPGYVSDRTIELLDRLPDAQRRRQVGGEQFRLHGYPGQEILNRVIGNFYGQRGGPHWYLGQASLPAVYRAILTGKPYAVRAMIVSASNPMVSHPDTARVYRALGKLELLVVMDVGWTPTAQLADYVLPATSWLERPMLYSEGGFGKVLEAIAPVLPGRTADHDRRNDFDLWRGLGVRLGQAADWPWESVEQSYAERIAPTGRSWEQLVRERHVQDVVPRYCKHESAGFATPTGKVELSSTVLARLGYDPLPSYRPPRTSAEAEPPGEGAYPLLLLNGARVKPYMLSTWRDVPAMRTHYPDPLVQVHPRTAERHGVADGDWIWIESRAGRIRQRCSLTDDVPEGVIHCDAQWWYPELPGHEPWLHGVWMSNVNVLLEAEMELCDPAIGSWPQRIGRATIRP
jgi:anaerobic selenocysteine-containing dehydrogenase